MELKILGVACGNGVMVYPFKKYLKANIEPRSDYKTPENIQWKLNFGDIPILYKTKLRKFRDTNVVISHPTCGHSSMLAYSRGKKLGNARKD